MRTVNLVRVLILSYLYLFAFEGVAQNADAEINKLNLELNGVREYEELLISKIDSFKLIKIIHNLKKAGLPSENYHEYSAMILEYDEETEQAKWVTHIIMPEIKTISISRTNNFRVDTRITTGTAQEQDYFSKQTQSNGKIVYNSSGFDRGHLAPSADFRWNYQALSESYFYSNISPQNKYFNRGAWADIETIIRSYVLRNDTKLFILTAPVFDEKGNVKTIGINEVAVPSSYVKVAFDPVNFKKIAFHLKNDSLETEEYDMNIISVDSAEQLLGFEIFQNLDTLGIKDVTYKDWQGHYRSNDAEPISTDSLPKNAINTTQVHSLIGMKRVVCGTVVANHISRKGNLFLTIDMHYPYEVFKVMIRKEDIINFPYDISKYTINQKVCFEGKIEKFMKHPSITINESKQIVLVD